MKALIPTPIEIGREALLLIAGAAVAAVIVSAMPGFKLWLREKWGVDPSRLTY